MGDHMKGALLIDFGSTYTKLTAVDIDNEVILATAKSATTVSTDIMDGLNDALKKMNQKIGGTEVEYVEKIACSSAAGGLKMVTVGLVPELTAEAAKRAALGAGAKVTGIYSFELTKSEIAEIKGLKPEIILLSGGTDGGNKDCIIHNAKMIADNIKDVPVVVAGNKNAAEQVEEILKSRGMYYKITENVMPKLNILNVEPAKEIIRQVFMDKIIEAKGMKNAENYVNGILMPTPAAVLKAAQLLADGTDKEDGIGDLVIIDIGGATTDVHSIASGEPTKPSVTLRGLQEPYAKRTVEGDLGMRVSAYSLWQAAGTRCIKKYANTSFDIEERCKYLADNINLIANNDDEIRFDEALSMAAVEIAMNRHVGTVEIAYTPMGPIYVQTGKDLSNVKNFIGTGGVLVHSENPGKILKAGLYNQENGAFLKPESPDMLIDREYILSAMGLLAQKYPDKAVRIMKKYISKC